MENESAKNVIYSERVEKAFGFLKVMRVSYPNATYMFQFRPVNGSDDPRGCISITTQPGQLLREFETGRGLSVYECGLVGRHRDTASAADWQKLPKAVTARSTASNVQIWVVVSTIQTGQATGRVQ